MDFEKRRQKLRQLMKKADATAFLVTSVNNVTYLTGFTGDSSYLLVHADGEVLLSDPRYQEQLESECPGLELFIRPPSTTLLEATIDQVEQAGISRLLVESQHLSLAAFEILHDKLKTTQIGSSTGIVETLREIKDVEEIARIERAISMAERAYRATLPALYKTQTERQVAHQLETAIRQLGGTGCSFTPIVGVGARAALPHGVPTDVTIQEADFVLVDWGAKEDLYISDLTRVAITGKISSKFEKVYNVVLQAQLAAIEKIRPGVPACDVDRAARSVIESAGYGKKFGHALGHGIGLQVHESPRMGAEQSKPLLPGMVVTVEPGIYLPGWGGIRIEDDVLVTRDGHLVLSSLPKDLESNVVTLL